MPIGQVVAEVAAQAVMELGGTAIKERYGCRGCILATLVVIALIGTIVWYSTS
jgi:hypothetical protein